MGCLIILPFSFSKTGNIVYVCLSVLKWVFLCFDLKSFIWDGELISVLGGIHI